MTIRKDRLNNQADRLGTTRNKPTTDWEQLSCPPDTLADVRAICTEFSPGKTAIGLFAGQQRAAKLAAEVVATELNKDLVRIDLGAIVSKLIGETEKNLQRVFDAAEQDGAVLLLDEADALFGKRSDVRDSHDRYANLEVSYLLQRIEAYPGLVIIATNERKNLDPAFLRRLRFSVEFPVS